jgi:toxin-antitoxin system PIN domain toxin
VVIPDLNLLVYAHANESPRHEEARAWWQDLVLSEVPIGLALVVKLGFIRLMSNPSVVSRAIAPAHALELVEEWLKQPNVQEIWPTSQHDRILSAMLRVSGAGSKLVNDAHLAALCVERNAEFHSNDTDFARFPGLRYRNPLEP